VQPGAAALADLDRALAGPRLLPGGPRWTDPSRWHITVAFLGEVGESRVDGLVAAVGMAAAAGRPVWLRLRGVGTFPARGAPRVLWAGVAGAAPAGAAPQGEALAGAAPVAANSAGADRAGAVGPAAATPGPAAAGDGELAQLERTARAVARAARSARVPVERRPFRPHLTLGRWRSTDPADRALAGRLADYAGPAFEATEIVLMRSRLGPDPQHERLLAWPLRDGG
jgi:2'-5' RNA ligase